MNREATLFVGTLLKLTLSGREREKMREMHYSVGQTLGRVFSFYPPASLLNLFGFLVKKIKF